LAQIAVLATTDPNWPGTRVCFDRFSPVHLLYNLLPTDRCAPLFHFFVGVRISTLTPGRMLMTSHAPPRLSSQPSHQSWRQFDEKSPAMSSLSSTLKSIPTRGWLASTPSDTIPMHHHQKNSDDKGKWRGSPQQLNLLTSFRKVIRNILRSSEVLPTSTTIPRRASSLAIGRPPSFASLSSPTLPAPALPSLSTVRFVLLCGLWYTSSALSSNTGKAILNQFRYPITLTFVQFGFVAAYCLLFMSPLIRFTRIRRPTRAILRDTLPMGCFQVGGHIFSSMAISRIPVSTTHTIKVRINPVALCQI
jgi:Triose-phosphate Transporter family